MDGDSSGNRIAANGRHSGNPGNRATENREGDHALGSHERNRPPLGSGGADHRIDVGCVLE
jgi:hypothetical protein